MGRKITVWIFQATNWPNLAQENRDMASKRETESLLMAAQNKATKINYIKAKSIILNRIASEGLSGSKYETINRIVSECSKVPQNEYKTKHEWVGRVIHWELCKKLKFDHTNEWYMHKSESILLNEMHKFIEILRYERITHSRTEDLTSR